MGGGLACPAPTTAAGSLRQTRACNNAVPCRGRGKALLCGGTERSPMWRLLGGSSQAMYADVDTRSCHLRSDEGDEGGAGGGAGGDAGGDAGGGPMYAASVVGDVATWAQTGSHSIANRAAGSFRIFVHHPGLDAGALRRTANRRGWAVSWMVGFGVGAGAERATAWRPVCKATFAGLGAGVASAVESCTAAVARFGHTERALRSARTYVRSLARE